MQVLALGTKQGGEFLMKELLRLTVVRMSFPSENPSSIVRTRALSFPRLANSDASVQIATGESSVHSRRHDGLQTLSEWTGEA